MKQGVNPTMLCIIESLDVVYLCVNSQEKHCDDTMLKTVLFLNKNCFLHHSGRSVMNDSKLFLCSWSLFSFPSLLKNKFILNIIWYNSVREIDTTRQENSSRTQKLMREIIILIKQNFILNLRIQTFIYWIDIVTISYIIKIVAWFIM